MKYFLFLLFVGLSISAKCQTMKLEGTEWLLVCKGCDIQPHRIVFLADGKIALKEYGDNDGSEESWKQRGDKVIISYSNGYAIYKGKITENLLVGTAKNKPGKTWEWSAERVKD